MYATDDNPQPAGFTSVASDSFWAQITYAPYKNKNHFLVNFVHMDKFGKLYFYVCVSVHHIWNWREIPIWCNNLFIIINNSTCFGHLYAHLQEYWVVYVLYYSIWCPALGRIQHLHQCTRLHTGSSEPQPQHLVLNTIWSSIIRIQPNTPEDGHIDARNM